MMDERTTTTAERPAADPPARRRRRGWARWVAVALAIGGVAVALELRNPDAAAQAPAKPAAKPAAGPLEVDAVTVKPEPHALSVGATGQLAPAEAVDVVSELSRRLVRIRVEEGAQVKKGDVLFEVDASELAARHARLKVARDLAQRVLARRRDNQGTGAVSPHEIDVAQTEVAALEAEMREVATQLTKTRIRAPFDGVVGRRRVSEGAWLTPEVVIATLYDTSRYKIDFTLAERYASAVAVGGTFSFSASGGKRGAGTIAVIEPAVDPGSRSVRVRGVVEDGEGLVPGTFANVTLALAPRDALFVPTIAVDASVEGHSVYVIEDGRAQKRAVEIGERTAERIEITRGLNPGDVVAISNLLRLKPDAPVSVRPAP